MTPTFLHSLYAFCRSTVLHFLAVAPLTRAEGLSSRMSGVICGQSPRDGWGAWNCSLALGYGASS